MHIACLHSADSNIAIFDAAAAALGLAPGTLRHAVRADLLFAAERTGGLTPEIVEETAALLRALARDADAVLLTCSTLGPSIDPASAIRSRVPLLRVDAALAEAAVEAGGKVVVLCATETTVAPTTALFEAAARRTGAAIDVRLVPGAWALFRQGDAQAYLASIAQAATVAYAGQARSVALAQASMAPAAAQVAGGSPFTSPAAGLRAALASTAARPLSAASATAGPAPPPA